MCFRRVGLERLLSGVIVVRYQKIDKVLVSTALTEYAAAIRQAYMCASRA